MPHKMPLTTHPQRIRSKVPMLALINLAAIATITNPTSADPTNEDPANAEIVFSQPTTTNDELVGLGWYSSSSSRPTRNFKHADNFRLDQQSTINQVTFWGLTEGLTHTDLSNFDSFTIEFWTSLTRPNGRIKPDELISAQNFAIDLAQTTQTGRAAPTGAIEYQHQITLDQSIEFTADTNYWISISARSIDPSADVWQWQDADLYDGISNSWSYATGTWLFLQDTDSAFELGAIPSPSTSILFIFAASGLTRRRR
jgi:hypothetical protein